MPKIVCRVIGHRIVKPGRGKEAQEMTRVEIAGESGLSGSFIVPRAEEINYPYGSEAMFGFQIQQSLALENGEGGRDPEKKPRRRKNAESEGASASAH